MLFALLAILAATFDARLSGSRFEEYVSAPADPQGEAAPFANATLSAAEDLEEEADQDEATFLALATLHCASEAGYQATNAWLPPVPRPSGHSCTGPPTF